MTRYSSLERPVRFLAGVGPQRAELLQRMGLLTARDVLYHIPHRYEDASTIQPIGGLAPGMEATVIGRVVSKGVIPTRKGLRIFQAVVRDSTGLVECSWPGQPFLDRVIRKGDLLLLSGSVRFFHGIQLQPREYTPLARDGEEASEERGTVFPVYPTTEGLSHRQLRAMMSDNLGELLEQVAEEEEVLAQETIGRYGLPSLPRALDMLHRPASLAEAEEGRRRLAFEELFLLQLLHARARHRATVERPGIAFRRSDGLVRPFYAALPFALTAAQKRVLREIGEDMTSPRRMHRLLQGDVGSGKTVVALFAMLRAVENDYQAALMAPTEILAEQHLRTIRALLADLPVPVTLLTGRLGSRELKEAARAISSGAARIVVGTHALIQEGVTFARLGVAVVDEQHRFGVRQRMALAEVGPAGASAGGAHPDLLVMSATPIPRSLALTLYGDLDLSILDEQPAGRRPIRTAIRHPRARGEIMEFVRRQAREGRQAYLVYPLVEESEKVDLRSAVEEYERLRTEVFPELRVGLVHGQLAAEEKERVMRAFVGGEIDVLVSTTVVEVGIDVANATVMVVEHAERFGLSQLHQLRGRVGRGEAKSYCILVSESADAAERLRILASTEDGFAIAEADLRLRGEGDRFGARQSGLPGFRFAELPKDGELLLGAREEARQMVEEDPELRRSPGVRAALEVRYGDRARMLEVG